MINATLCHKESLLTLRRHIIPKKSFSRIKSIRTNKYRKIKVKSMDVKFSKYQGLGNDFILVIQNNYY